MNEETNTSASLPEKGKRGGRIRIGYLFGALMLVIYLGMAVLLAFTPFFSTTFRPALRYLFAVVFAAYAIFRGYRFFKDR
ncbi:MAG: hypothetical protein LUI04_02285 [Porphyromonadaceae bacterium]|nr:hypothetical protein [Porphyromonadaceae bacterium]